MIKHLLITIKNKGYQKALQRFLLSLVFLLMLAVSSANAAVWYSKSAVSPHLTTSWTANADGTGANPTNFTTAGDLFRIQATYTNTQTNNWTLGANVDLQIDGTLDPGNNDLTVGGATTITTTGNFTDGNTNSVNTFTGLVTQLGGTWNTSIINNPNDMLLNGGYTFSGGTFTLGAVTIGADQTITANAAITVGDNFVTAGGLTVAGAGGLTINSTVACSILGNLNVTGLFTVATTGNNGDLTVTGTTNITGSGVMVLAGDAAGGRIITLTGLVTLNSSGSFTSTGFTVADNLRFDGGITNTAGTFNTGPARIAGGTTITPTVPINFGGNITTNGTGNITIANGSLVTVSAGNFTTAAGTTGNLVVGNGGLLVSTTGSFAVTGTTSIAGDFTDNNNASTTTFTGLVTKTGGTWTSTTVTTAANMVFTGGFTNTAGAFSGGAATIGANTTLTPTAAMTFAGTGGVVATGTLTVGAGLGVTVSDGPLSAVNVSLSTATSILTLGATSGNSAFSGTLATTAGAQLNVNTTGTFAVTGTTTNNGSITDSDNTAATTFTGAFTNGVAGTFTSTAVTTAGRMIFNGGIVQNNTTAGSFAAGTIDVNTASAWSGAGPINIASTLTATGVTLTNNNTGGVSVVGVLSGTGTFTQGTNGVLKLGNALVPSITTVDFSTNCPNTVEYNYAGAQAIRGTTYCSLTISGGGNKTPSTNITVNTTLTLNDGVIVLGANTFSFGVSATAVAGTINGTSMIQCNSTGAVRKYGDDVAGVSFTFPVGTATDYTPASITTTAVTTFGGGAGSRYIAVRPVASKAPSQLDNTYSLSRYWEVSSINLTTVTASMTYTYINSEADAAEEANYVGAYYNNTNWNVSGTVNAATDVISFSYTALPNLTGNYTAGKQDAFAGTYYSRVASGNWETSGTWSTTALGGASCACTPPAGAVVIIGNGNTVTKTSSAALSISSLQIDATSTLDMGEETGLSIGIFESTGAGGNGTIKLTANPSPAVFPTVTTNNFNSSTDGTVEYYDISTTSYNLPAAILTYPNLTISGPDIKTINAMDVLVNGNISIGTGAELLNNTGNLTVTGTTTTVGTGKFTDNNATGTNTFNGLVTNNGTFLTTTTIVASRLVFNAGFTNAGTFTVPTATATGTLTPTAAMNFTGAAGLVGTGTLTIGAGLGVTVSGGPLAAANIDLSTATSILTVSGAAATNTISGTLTTATSSQLTVSSTGTFAVTGATTNAGVFTDNNNTAATTFTGLVTNTGSFITTNVTTAANMVFNGGFTHTSGTFTVPTATATGTLTPTTAMNFTGASGLVGTGTLTIGAGAGVTVSGGPLAAVNVDLSTATSILTLSSGNSTISGTLATAASSQFNLSTTGTFGVTGATTNAGIFTDSDNTAATTFTGLVTNTGSFITTNVTTSARMVFNGGFTHTSGTFTVPTATATGTLTPTTAMTFTHANGLVGTGTLTIGTGAGVTVSGGPLAAVNLDLNTATSIFTLGAGSGNSSLSGTLTTSASAQLNINTTGTFDVTGATTNNGAIVDDENSAATTFTGAFTNGATGTFTSTAVTTAGRLIFRTLTQNNTTAGAFAAGAITVNFASPWSGTGAINIANALTVTGVVLTNTNTGGVSVVGDLTGTGTFTQGTNGVLRLGNALVPSITTTDFSTNCPNTVEYNFAGAQAIKGTTYCSLTTSGGGNKTPNGSTIVNTTLTLTSGVIVLGANSFTFGVNATAVAGSPSGTSMIQCNGAGTVIKNYDATGSFIFPVGTTTNYTPASINITAATFGAPGTNNVSLRPIAAKAPSQIDDTYSLSRYWAVTSTNLSGISATMTYTYINSEADATEEVNYIGAFYNSTPNWDVSGTVNAATDVISFSYSGLSNLNGNYTAGLSNAFVGTYYSIASANWETAGTWSTIGFGQASCACIPVNGAVVVVGDAKTVTKSNSTALAITSLQIDAGGILDMGTQTGLTVTTFKGTGTGGNGTIKLASATYPTVTTTNNFNSSTDGTVEFTTGTYSLPSTPLVYPNLTISGTGTKTAPNSVIAVNANLTVGTGAASALTLGTANLTVAGNLTIGTTATLTPTSGNFTITGTSAIAGNFTDATAAGVNTFTGLVTKTAGTWTSTAVVTAANMVFSGGFTNTSGTFSGGAATIGASKTLTPTVAMSFAGSGGLTATGTLTIDAGLGVSVSGGPLTAANVDLNTATSILTLSGAAAANTISGTLNTTASSQLTVSSTGTLAVTGAFTNAGVFTDSDNTAATTFTGLITNTGSFVTTNVTTNSRMVFNGGFTHTSGTFTVPTATATGTLTPTTAMNFTAAGGLVGTGTLTIGAGLGVSVSGGPLTAVNVDLNTATSILNLSSGNSSISGTLATAASAQLTVSTTGTFGVTGATTNAGIFTDNDNTAATTFTGLITNTGSFVTSSVTTASRMVFNGGFTHTSGTFTVPTATATGTLTPTTAMNFTGAGGLVGTGTLTIGAGLGVTVSGGSLAAANVDLNTATSILTLSSGNSTISGTLATATSAQLTVSTTGTFAVTGATTNNGSITDNNNTAATTFTGAFTNGAAGTFVSTAITTAGNMIFNGGIAQNNTTAGSFTAGTINVNSASAWSGAGPINIASTLTVTGVVLTNNNTSGVTVIGVLSGNGTFTQGTNGVLKLGNAAVPSITTVDFSTNAGNTVEYNFAGNQAIRGTTYRNLSVDGGGNKTPSANVTVNSTLTFTDGVIVLGANTFTFGASATAVGGVLSGTNMIQCNTTGTVTKNYDATGSFTFPVGTATDYTPATINITAATFGAPGTNNVALKSIPSKAPSQIDDTYSLSRYWAVTSTNLSAINATMTYTYVPADANAAQEANYIGAYYNTVNWDVSGTVASPVITFTYAGLANLTGNYTAGIPSAFSNTYYSRASANWEVASTWSNVALGGVSAATVPPTGAVIIIGGGNTVTRTVTAALSISSLQIDATGILDMGTTTGLTIGTFENIGTGGNGTIKLAGAGAGTATFPTVTTNDFNSSTDGTVEYNTTNIYNLPTTPTAYPNLIISGASVKTVQAGVDLTINGNLTVATGATLSIGTGNFTVAGTTSLVGSFTDDSNTGITTFTGLVTKTNGTFTSTAVTTAANMVFGGGFTNTLGVFAGGAATIGADKTLTPTVTMSFAGTGGLTATGTLTIGAGAAAGVTVSGGPLNAVNVDLSTATSVLTLSSGNSAISGTLNTVTSSQLTVSTAGTFTVGGAFTNAGVFTDDNNAAVTTFNGLITNTGSFITSGVTTSSRMVFNGGFTYTSGTFTVPTATASGTLTPTTAMNFAGTGGLIGTGTLNIGAGAGVTVSVGTFTAANVDLNTATSILTLSAGSPTISGTLNTVAGAQLTVSTTGAFDVTGAFTNAGTFTDNNNTATSSFGGLVTNTGSFVTSSVTTAARLVFNGGFTHTSGTFTVPTATATGTLTPTTAMNFTGAGGLVGTGTLAIGAGAGVTVSGGPLVAANVNLSSGTSILTLSSGNSTISGTLATTAGGQLTVSTTGTFAVTGATTNNGSITDNNNTAATTFTGAFTNGVAGTFTSTAVTTAGRMIFNGGITQNNTTVSSFAAGTIDVNTVSGWSGAGPIDIAGTLTVTGVVLTNTNTGGVSVVGVLSGTGTFTQGTNGVLKLGNALVPSITTVDFSTNCPNTVEYNFAGAQAIKGTTYCSLTTSGGGNKTPNASTIVKTTLTLNSGVIVLGANTFTFGADATAIAGTPSGTSMIQCSGAGTVIKNYDIAGAFTFPVGTTTNYTPASINITAATFAGAAGSRNVSLRPIAAKAPSQVDNTYSLSRYWAVTSTNLSAISASMTYTYINSEADATEEANYIGAFYNSTPYWEVSGTVNAATDVISLSYTGLTNLNGNYTAGIQAAFVLTYYSIVGTGNWETNGTWSTVSLAGASCACVPVNGGIVIIGSGNTITKTASTALSISSLQIDATSTLDMGTQTGLTIGTFKSTGAGGNGTIKLAGTASGTAVFPSVTTNNFNSSTDGTVEYNTTNTYNLPTTPTSYPNLTISGASTKTIQALVNTTINGNLTVATGAGLTVSTGNLTVTGTTSLVGNFTDASNTGTTTFTGLVTKTGGIFTSTAVTTAANMVLNGGFTNTTGAFAGGAATIGANQTLTPTVAMSFAGSGGLAATGTLTIGAGLGVTVSGGPLAAVNVDLNTATSILTVSGAAAANTITGTLNTVGNSELTISSTGTLTVTGTTTNAGIFIDNDNTAASTFTGLVTNTGSWTTSAVTTPANMVFNGGFTNTSGTFTGGAATIGAGQTITPTAAMSFAGALNGAGALTIANGALVTTSAGNSSVAGNLSIGAGGLTVSTSGTFSVNGTTTNAGVFTDNDNTAVTTFTGLVTNTGSFVTTNVITASNLVFNGGFTHTSGTFTVPTATATGTLTPTAAMNFTGAGGVVGSGTLTIGAGLGVTVSGGPLAAVNVDLNTATSILNLSSGNSSISGTLATAASSQLTVSTTGTFTVTGATTNAGIFTDNNNTAATTFTGLVTNTGSFVTTNVTTAANLLFNGGFTHTSGTFTVPTATATGTLTPTATMNFTGAGGLVGTGTLTIGAGLGVTVSGGPLAAASVNLNTATSILTLSSGNSTISGTLATAASAQLTVSTTGTFAVTGATTNNGSFTDSDNTAATTFTGAFTNGAAGTFTSTAVTTAGRMIFNGGITQNNTTAGSFVAGAVDVNSASTWSGAGPINIGGTLTATGVVLTNTNTGGVGVVGVLSGTGTFTQGTNGILKLGNALVPSITAVDFGTNCPNTVEYNFAGAQAIRGTTYCSLTTSGGGDKTPNAATTVNTTLTLTSGVIVLGANNFTFGASATFAGAPSGTNMIQCNGAGTVIKNYDATGSFIFPVGTTTNYTPASINVTAATFDGAAGSRNVSLKPVAAKAPSQIDDTYSLSRYWAVTSTNLSGISASMTYTYINSEADATEEVNYVGAFYNTDPYWDVSGTVNTATDVISFTYNGLSNLTGNYTAGIQSAFVQTYYSIVASGNWETAGTWSTTSLAGASCACIPVNGGVVIIGSGNTVTKTNSTALAITSLQIDATSTLDMGTQTGLTIGTFKSTGAGGNGTIKLATTAATATYPTITTNNFNSSTDGTVEFNTANIYNLPSGLTTYPNLIISGASVKTVHTGTANVTINGNLTVATGASLSNGTANFTVAGTSSLVGSFTDASNTGTTTFTGLVTKTGGTFTSTAVTTAGNMVFSGGFTNTSGTFSGGAATIGANQTLTPTVAMSFAGTGGLVASGTLTIGAGLGVTVSGGPLAAANVDLNTATSILNLSSGNSTISGTLATAASSQLTVSTTGTFAVTGATTNAGIFTDSDNTAATTFTGLVTNTGSFVTTNVTTASRLVFNGGFTHTSGTFTVPTATATGTLTPTTGMNFTGAGGLVGTGTLTIGAGAGVTVSGGALAAANVNLSVATSILTLSGAAASNTISGTLATAASSQLTVSSTGTFVVTGATTNAGIFTDNNNTAATTFTGLVTNTGSFITTNVTTASNLVFNGGFTHTSGTFTIPTATATGTLTPTAAMNFTGAGGLVGTGTLTIGAGLGVTVSGGPLAAANVNLNTATSILTLSSGNSTISGTLATAASAQLTVSTTGTFAVTGATTNNGSFTDSDNTAVTTFTGAFTNGATATFTSTAVTTAGRMIFNGGITQNNTTAGSFAAGAVNVNTLSTWSGAGPIDIAGGLAVTGVVLTNTNSGGVSVVGVLSGTGTFTQGTNGVLKLGNAAVPTITAVDFSTNCPNTVEYNFAGAQALIGTTYCSLTTSGGGNKTPNAATIVNTTLTLTSGVIVLGGNNFTFGASATAVAGAPSGTSMIQCNGAGTVIKNYDAFGNFIFPVGTTTNYTPASINITAAAFAGGNGSRNVSLKPVAAKAPSQIDDTYSLSRYWAVTSTNLSAISASMTYTYINSEADATEEANYIGAFYNSTPYWDVSGTVNAATNVISFTYNGLSNLSSNYTAGIQSAFVQTYYSIVGTGNWETNGTWSTTSLAGASCACIPVNGGVVVIGSGNAITKTTSTALAITSLQIDAASSLDMGTQTDLTITTFKSTGAGGNGTIKLSGVAAGTATFPTVTNNDFGSSVDGTVEYNSTNTYSLPSTPIAYPNLIISGASVKTIQPLVHTTISGTLTVAASAGLTITNGNLTVAGTTSLAGNFTDAHNNGTTTFTGLVTKTGGTFTSTAVTTAANMVFSGGFTNTTGTFSGGSANVGANKTLTPTAAMSFAGSGGLTATGTLTIGAGLGVTVSGGPLTAVNVDLSTATSILTLSGAAATSTISGTLNTTASSQLTVSSTGTLAVTGATTNAGIFTDNNNTAATTFTGLVTNTGSFITTNVTTAANMVFNGGFTHTSGTFTVPSATATGTLTPTTAMNFTGAGGLVGTGTLNIGAGAGVTVSGGPLTATNVDLNTATSILSLSSGNSSISGTLATAASSQLTVSTTGTFAVTGAITNNGSITDNNNTAATTFTGAFTNGAAGTFTSTAVTTAGRMIFNGGVIQNNTTAASFATGAIDVNTASSWSGAGPIDIAGTLTVTGVALTNTNTEGVSVVGVLSGTGTFTQGTNGILKLGNTLVPSIAAVDFSTNCPNTVEYNFAGAQAIKGTTYCSLTISAGGNKTPNDNVIVNNTLTLTDGTVSLGAYNLTMASGAGAIAGPVLGATSTTFIVTDGTGGLVRNNMGGGTTYFFPVGSGTTSYTPCSITNAGASDNFTVRINDGIYERPPATNAIVTYSVDKTYNISEAVDGGSDVSLTVQWNGVDELPSFNRNLSYISHYSDVDSFWTPRQIAGVAVGAGPYTRTVSGLSSFSPHGVASAGGPLPINLLSFDAVMNGSNVDLTWTTAAEIDNDYFTIEKSQNTETFEIVARVKGAVNSTELLEYTLLDEHPYSGVSYYRLKQTDFDGKFSYSKWVAVDNKSFRNFTFKVFPNPVLDGESIYFTSTNNPGDNKEVLVVLYDALGNLLYSKVILSDNGAFHTAIDPSQKLAAGIYFVIGSSNNDVYRQKLIVK